MFCVGALAQSLMVDLPFINVCEPPLSDEGTPESVCEDG